jgi:predicted nucleic acid-binding protein
MARYFLDSSALVKRYHVERGSERLTKLFATADNRFFVARLGLVELHSTFARLVREGALPTDELTKVLDRLAADVASNLLTVVAVSSPRFDAASEILRTVGLTHSIRTLDALHLATAQALDRRSRLASFVAADKKLLASAAACGLATEEIG